jgi:hypothetical protein
MIDSVRPHGRALATNRLAILGRDFQAHIINYSSNGCLLETSSPLDVGTVGTLRFVIDGREFADDVQVVRCQPIEGAGSQYQVGAKFLWTSASGGDSLRSALGLLVGAQSITMVG